MLKKKKKNNIYNKLSIKLFNIKAKTNVEFLL